MSATMRPRQGLVAEFAARLMIQRCPGGVGAVAAGIVDGRLLECAKAAEQMATEALAAVRSAPDADPAWTDDDIARLVLDRIAARREQQKGETEAVP